MNKEIVGFTAGNFDLLHPGYIYTFEEAKRHCDRLLIFFTERSKCHTIHKIQARHTVLRTIQSINGYKIYR